MADKPSVEVTILGNHSVLVERGRVDVNEGEDFINPYNDQAQTLLLAMLLEELQKLRHEVKHLTNEVSRQGRL